MMNQEESKVNRRRRSSRRSRGSVVPPPQVVYDVPSEESQEEIRLPDQSRKEQLLAPPVMMNFDREDEELNRAIQESLFFYESQYQRPLRAPTSIVPPPPPPTPPPPRYRPLEETEKRELDFLRSRWRFCHSHEENPTYFEMESYLSELLDDDRPVSHMPCPITQRTLDWFLSEFEKHPLFQRLIPFLKDPRDWLKEEKTPSESDRTHLANIPTPR